MVDDLDARNVTALRDPRSRGNLRAPWYRSCHAPERDPHAGRRVNHGAPLARARDMQARHLSAAVALALSSALLTASCLQRSTAASETDPGEVQSSSGPESIGQAQEESGSAFSSDQFRFVVVLKDDGEGEAGGWQAAEKTFSFVERDWGIPVYLWKCRIGIEMPLRCAEGRITPSRAALYAADVANVVVDDLLDSRSAWRGQGGEFCREAPEGHAVDVQVHAPGSRR